MLDRSPHVQRALHALAMVDDDPAAARAIAEEVLAATSEAEATTVALRCIGRAQARQGAPREARRVLRRAIMVAERNGLPVRSAQARASLVVVLVALGKFELALAEAARAESSLSGADRGHLLAQRAVALARLDRTEEALAAFGRALRLTPRTDTRTTALLLMNRGLLLTYRGAFVTARRDLQRAAELCRAHRLRTVESYVIHNLGYLALLEGDLVRALAELDRSEAMRRELAVDVLEVVLDRAEALLTAHLTTESVATASAALALAAASGRLADVAEAELTLARAQLVAGDPTSARTHAERARRLFRRQRRPGWSAIADELVVRARWAAGERRTTLIEDALACARNLDAAGWPASALRARVVAAEALLAAGRADEAASQLRTASTAARTRGDADLRVAAWHAEALLRLARGDRRGALRALTAGLDVVDAHSAALGATDLRTQSMTRGRQLAELGLDLVMDRDRPRDVLRWLERVRTSVLRRRPARPPRDARLAGELADLRRVSSALARARAAGQDTADLVRQQLRLERLIRDGARHARGAGDPNDHLDLSELGRALGERALVEYFWKADQVHAVVMVGGRCTIVELDSYTGALREAESLRFALHRLARRHGSTASLDVARHTRAYSAEALDRALLAPLDRLVRDRELVVVPTRQLHALPWPALPSLAGRPVSVAPSAAVWLAAARTRRRTGATVVVAGPDLVFAEPELRAVARLYPGATRLRGDHATAERVQQAMDGARVAHIACHGHFRSDNPQFSSLRLADGPLWVYDLERLRRAPDMIVLSSCEAGLSAVHPGDELMGLSSALFALGTRTLVAAVNPVDDEAAKTLMVDFHARLAAGRPPAAALAEAQAAHGTIGFTCFGAG